MAESEEVLFLAHVPVVAGCSEKSVNMSTSLQVENSNDINPTKESQNESYNLRKNTRKMSDEITQLLHSNINSQTLPTVKCKSVSVQLTKLPISNLKDNCKGNTSQHWRCSHHDMWLKSRLKTTKNAVQKRAIKSQSSRRNVQSTVSKEVSIEKQKFRNYSTRQKESLLKTVRQPYVRLHRIDEVINKIALTFAKVIPNKKCQAPIIAHAEKTPTESSLVELESSKFVPVNDNVVDECSKNSESQRLQTDDSITEEFPKRKKLCDRKFKRKRRVIYYSQDESSDSNDNNDFNEIVSRKIRRLDPAKSEEEVETCFESEKCIVSLKTITENKDSILQPLSPGKPNISDISCGVFNEQSEKCKSEVINIGEMSSDALDKLSTEPQPDSVDENIEDSCDSKDIFSELELADTTENNASQIIESMKESSLENNELKTETLQLKESLSLDECLIKKYKLFMELKVLIIKYDFMKSSLNSPHLVLEVEQLTQQCMNNLINSKRIHAPFFGKTVTSAVEKRDFVINSEKNVFQNGLGTSASSANKQRMVSNNNDASMQKVCKNLTTLLENDSSRETSNSTTSENAKKALQSPFKHSKENADHSVTEKKSLTKSKKWCISLKEKETKAVPRRDSITELNNLGKPHLDCSVSHKVSEAEKHAERNTVTTIFLINTPVTQKKDSNKSNESCAAYKCIVCDDCFDNYYLLQQHLSIHRQTHTVDPSVSTEEVSASPESEKVGSPQSSNQESLRHSKVNKKSPKKKKVSEKDSSSTKKKKKRLKSTDAANNIPNDCEICSKTFLTKTDLAAHIFLHTESELQEAFERAKEKLANTEGKYANRRHKKVKKSPKKTMNLAAKKIAEIKKGLSIASQKKLTSSESSSTKQQDTSQTSINNFDDLNELAVANSPTLMEVDGAERNQGKEKSSRAILIRKPITICDCHDKCNVSENFLRIEIVLLCNTCRILFRSMECFETHYRLPEHSACNRNRIESCRSPRLFCANCGMMFTSVQDVRQHLELHARFKQSFTVDFRCNVCKIIFIGIGSLFYLHWSKHAKDAFWIASETTFPKAAIIKSSKEGNKSNEFVNAYLQVAEYICSKCKVPFQTDCDLKKHKLTCNVPVAINEVAKPVTPVEKCLKVRLICSLCNDAFNKKSSLDEHAKVKHNFGSDPQSVHMFLRNSIAIYICYICMEITKSKELFNEHWSKHKMIRETFTCTHCNKDSNSIDSFVEHAKEHGDEIKDTPSCKVNFTKAEFACTVCKIGFENQQKLTEHSNVHRFSQVMKTSSNGTSQVCVKKLIVESAGASNIETNQESTEKLAEKSGENGEKVDNQVTEDKTQTKSNVENKETDEEKSTTVEGKDDSEDELVIDLTERQEPGKKESQEKEKGGKEIVQSDPVPTSSEKTLTTTSRCVSSSASSSTITAQDQTSDNSNNIEPTETVVSEKSVAQRAEDVESPNTSTTASPIDEGDSLSTETNSLPTKRGFIRVKPLSELTAKKVAPTETLHLCEFCGFTTHDRRKLVEHFLQHSPDKYLKKIKVVPFQKDSAREMAIYHKNLPANTAIRKIETTPRSQAQTVKKPFRKIVPSPSTILVQNRPLQPRTEYSANNSARSMQDTNWDRVYKCSMCPNFQTNTLKKYLKHQVSDIHTMRKEHNYTVHKNANPAVKIHNANQSVTPEFYVEQLQSKQPQQQIRHSGFHYPYTTNSTPAQPQVQIQEVSLGQPIAGNSQQSFYCNPPPGEGMSIVIQNQAPPNVHNIPVVGTLQQQRQQPMYTPGLYNSISNVGYGQMNHSQVQWAMQTDTTANRFDDGEETNQR